MILTSPCPSLISDQTWQAYADTLFIFRDGPDLGVIRIGQCPDATTTRLLEREKTAVGSFITAYCPQHGPLQGTYPDNRVLREVLQEQGRKYFVGAGIGFSAAYDPEASLFVPGIGENDAISLGRQFGQNAVVGVTLGAPARLLLSR